MLKQKQNKRFFIFIFFKHLFLCRPLYRCFLFLFFIFIYLFIIIFLLKLINSAAQNHCLPRQKDAYGGQSSRLMGRPVFNANNTDDDTQYFPDGISEESCWDLVAMDCIRYEESMDCMNRISHISHNNFICCDFPLT